MSGWDFHLAGGTAVALQLGHRASLDLVLFSPTFAEPDALAAGLGKRLSDLEVVPVDRRTLNVTVEGVQVSFFGHDYPLLEEARVVEPGVAAVASIPDIAAMKLAAIASLGDHVAWVGNGRGRTARSGVRTVTLRASMRRSRSHATATVSHTGRGALSSLFLLTSMPGRPDVLCSPLALSTGAAGVEAIALGAGSRGKRCERPATWRPPPA